jgi:hypothetical protein
LEWFDFDVNPNEPILCCHCHVSWKRKQLEQRVELLETAIRTHRDKRGHELCWLNDRELWAVLGEAPPTDFKIPPREEFLGECAEYHTGLLGNNPAFLPIPSGSYPISPEPEIFLW